MLGKRLFVCVAMLAMVVSMAVNAMAGGRGQTNDQCRNGSCKNAVAVVAQPIIQVARPVVQTPVKVVQAAGQEIREFRAERSCCQPCPCQPSCSQPVASGGGLAQQKADKQASMQRMAHVGGGLGSGRFEGVGYHSSDPQAAIAASCYWNRKTPIDIGVTCNASGCYAAVIYK